MAHDTPAQMAIDEYITPTATAGWQGWRSPTLATSNDNDRSAGSRETAPQQARLGNYESGTSETDSLIVRQQRECVTDDDDDDTLSR